MAFGDVNTAAGAKALDAHLADKSYIGGYLPTQADVNVFSSLRSAPADSYVNALRWFKHIASFGSETSAFPAGDSVAIKPVASGASTSKAAPKATADDDDDDFDMFASDDEEDAEAEKVKAERLAAYAAKKAKKPALVAKSNVILDVKPWDDEVDLKVVEEEVRKIQTDGLLWGKAEKKPVAYGIFKLTISCVVEDDKVSVDWLEENITAIEDYVQSVDIAAFNKI